MYTFLNWFYNGVVADQQVAPVAAPRSPTRKWTWVAVILVFILFLTCVITGIVSAVCEYHLSLYFRMYHVFCVLSAR